MNTTDPKEPILRRWAQIEHEHSTTAYVCTITLSPSSASVLLSNASTATEPINDADYAYQVSDELHQLLLHLNTLELMTQCDLTKIAMALAESAEP
jgi:hypothetical protein